MCLAAWAQGGTGLSADPSHPGKLSTTGSQLNPVNHDDETQERGCLRRSEVPLRMVSVGNRKRHSFTITFLTGASPPCASSNGSRTSSATLKERNSPSLPANGNPEPDHAGDGVATNPKIVRPPSFESLSKPHMVMCITATAFRARNPVEIAPGPCRRHPPARRPQPGPRLSRQPGARDSAAFGLMFGCGFRRSETVAIRLEDLDPESCAIRVIGKGNRERTVYTPRGAQAAIDAWLDVRRRDEGPLLTRVSQTGVVSLLPMTAQSLMARLRKRAREARIAPCSPHDLRRSFVSAALEAGADLATVQTLAGHASPATTALYDRRPEIAKTFAAQLIHVPFG